MPVTYKCSEENTRAVGSMTIITTDFNPLIKMQKLPGVP